MYPARIALVLAVLAALAPRHAAAAAADDIVISEVFYNRGNESEWIELYNPTAQAVVLDGWTLDDGDNEGIWKIATIHPRLNFGIKPGGSVVIAQKASEFTLAHCSTPDFALIVGSSGSLPIEPLTTQPFLLNNSDDQVILRDELGTIRDAVGWGCQKASGSSPCGTDTNALLVPIAPGSSSTTNYRTAIRTDPTQEGVEGANELAEVLPLTAADADNGSSSGGYWTHVSATTLTGGVSNCDPDTSTYAHAGPTSGGLILYPYVSGVTVPSAAAGTGKLEMTVQGEAFQPGATVTFSGTGIAVVKTTWISPQAINVVLDIRPSAPVGVRDVTVSQPDGYGDTEVGAFTVTTHTLKPAADVIISELLIDGPGTEPDSEWIELHNPTGSFVALDGWSLWDGTTTWTFPDPVAGQDDLLLKPGGSVVIANDGDLFLSNTGLVPDLARTPGATGAWAVNETGGTFQLDNAQGGVWLYDAGGVLVDAVGWGAVLSTPEALAHPLQYPIVEGETFLRVERYDQGQELGGPLAEKLVEAFETSAAVPGGSASNVGEGPEVGGLQPIPIVSAVTPGTGEQGVTGLTVTLTGKNFDTNSAVLFSDTGITITSTTFVSSTELTVVIDISNTAPVSLRNVTVTAPGGYQGTLPGSFRVTLPIPSVVSITPNSLFQGAQSVVLTIVGKNTHFGAGDSQVLLGDGTGYAVESINVIDLTTIEVTVTFLLDATIGLWDVRVSTAAWNESASGTGLLEIRALPRVSAINPAQGDQGEILSVTLTGLYTDWTAKPLSVDFGTDIVVSNVKSVDATTVTCDLVIADLAVLGPRGATVTAGAETAPSPLPTFTVLPKPAVKTITPDTAFQGDSLYVTLEGLNSTWIDGTSVLDLGAGTTVESLTVNGPLSAVARVKVSDTATIGPRTVTLTTGAEVTSLVDGFTILGRPKVLSVSPSVVTQGQTGIVLTLTGEFTTWDGTSTVGFSDTGVTVTNITANSATELLVTVDVVGNAPLGLRDVLVTTGTEAALSTGGLRVTAQSYIGSVSPNNGTQGQSLTLEITGVNTGFDNTSVLDMGTDVTVTTVTASSPIRLVADITIATTATLGIRDVTVTTGGQSAVGSGLFNVRPRPYVSTVSPANAVQGTQRTVTITGVNTAFDSGSFASFGDGVAVIGTTVNSATELVADLVIAFDAIPGPRDVTVFTGGEIALGTGLFTVVPRPELVKVEPPAAETGAIIDVTVTGANTNFVNGVTTANFGASIGVTDVTVVSATELVASLTISGKAAAGFRTVTVETGGEQVTLVDGFEVLDVPRLRRITPSTVIQGDITVVDVEGLGTNFQVGDVSLDLGPGVTIDEVRVAGTLRFVADISVSPDAPIGLRDVVVTTSTQTWTLTDGFLVQGLSRVVSIDPPTGRREDMLSVTVTGANTNWGSETGLLFGEGIVVATTDCTGPTTCLVDLDIAPLARLGTRDVTVFTGTETARGIGAFEVLPKAEILNVFPERGTQGDELVITVVMGGVQIAAGNDAVSFGNGITVNSIDLSTDVTTATVDVSIASDAVPGPRDVTVKTVDAGDIVGTSLFQVDGRATLIGATPNQVPQGETVELVLTGTRTHFLQDQSIVDMGAGIAVIEVTVGGDEQLTARVRAAPNAELGARDVSVTTGLEVALGLELVTVVEASDGGGGTGTGGGCCDASGEGTPGMALGALLLLALLAPRRRRP